MRIENLKSVLIAVAFATVVAIVVGCGGGGSGSGTTGSTGSTTGGKVFASGQFLEFIDQGGAGKIVDPMNLPVGTTARIVFANYDTNGNRTVLSASNFKLAQGYPGTSLDANGLLRISSNPNNILDISATANVSGTSKTISAQAWVAALPGSTIITGKVVTTNGGVPFDYVQIDVFDKFKNRVGGGVTMNGGVFVAKVDATAYYVTIKSSTVPTGYFKQMNWNSHGYSLTGTTCLAHLASVPSNQTTNMGPITISAEADGPPSPPDGCNLG